MLPFTDIDFFLFAAIYVAMIWLFGFISGKKFYSEITFALTLIYLIFYFKYTLVVLLYGLFTFLFIKYVILKINNKLISSICIALPMIFVKVHFNPSWFYFAGLSFVTFRSIQVSLDYAKNQAIRFVDYFNFLFFIPSIFIGPLDRFKRFTDNCNVCYTNTNSDIIFKGLQEFIKGVLYKFVLAEFISRYWLGKSTNDHETVLYYANDIYAYSFFLLFDFAGYSSMAVGLANLVGIDLPGNFNKPFFAVNPPDFWQRWHSSLTSWLSDYFFKPFYKWLSQIKKLKKYPITKQNIAIFFTLFIMGIWNGFESNFLWSGVLYGFYSVVHNTYTIQCRKKDRDVVFGNLNPKLIRVISIFVLFNLVCISLYVFSGRYL